MPKIPQYNQQIQPDVVNTPEVPRLDLSGGLRGLNTIANANDKLAEAFTHIAGQVATHAEKQYKLQQEQAASQAYTKMSMDSQDWLLSKNQTTTSEVDNAIWKPGTPMSNVLAAKPVPTEVTRYDGELLNELGNSQGALNRVREKYFKNREGYLSGVADPETRMKLGMMLDNHARTVFDKVATHEVTQLQKNALNITESSYKQAEADGYMADTPEKLSIAIINTGHLVDANSAVKQLDSVSAGIANQESKANTVLNGVMGSLRTTGNVDASYALLDSVKDSLSPENHDLIKEKIQKAGVQLREASVHADNVQKTQTRFDTLDGFVKGKYNIDNSAELIRHLAISDPKSASALKDAVESPKGYTPVSDTGATYQKVVHDVFSASTPEEISKFMVSALKEHANGNISREQLSILYDGAIQRAKAFLPDGSMTPAQVEIDGGQKAILQWNKVHGNNDPETLSNYMKFIGEGKSNLGAYNMAIRTTLVKQHPEVASYEDVPNIVKQGDSKKYVFTGNTKIAPHFIYQPDKVKK